MKTVLQKIRLSWFFVIFFVAYAVLTLVLPRHKFEGAALTVFSVNSFLYGFYISPILSAQKARIEELHKIVRAEANAVFAMVLSTKAMPEKLRNHLQELFLQYLRAKLKNPKKHGEDTYEEIISFCISYKGEQKDQVDKLLEKVVSNQQNRTMLNMQLANKVYSNEWIIMMMLFSITLLFILLLDTGSNILLRVVTAMLCTGLSMLIVILVKLSTLTHKKAKQMWTPFHKLVESNFYRID